VEDAKSLLKKFRSWSITHTKSSEREANTTAHLLARHEHHVIGFLTWFEEAPTFFQVRILRAFPTHFGCILYFTTLKSIFSIIHTHFYITPHISFSTLQSIILKYYKIILFLYIFFQSNQTNGIHQNPGSQSTTTSTTRSTAQINNQAQPRSTTHSRLLNHDNHP
jgi:hypothetical protein